MRFWDASAIVPLIVPERESSACGEELARDRHLIVWGLTPVEALSAVHRQRREGRLTDAALKQARRRLESLRSAWTEVRDLPLAAARAERLLAVHALRAADALQLASALLACDETPARLPFVCLDGNLRSVAIREGFEVLPYQA